MNFIFKVSLSLPRGGGPVISLITRTCFQIVPWIVTTRVIVYWEKLTIHWSIFLNYFGMF